MRKLRQYDAGVVLEIPIRDLDDEALDLDGGETALILLEAPSGRRKELTATVDDAGNLVTYTTEELDFDEHGEWKVQARIVDSPVSLRSSILRLEVERALDRGPVIVELSVARFYLRPQPFDGIEFYPPDIAFEIDTAEGTFEALELVGDDLPITLFDGTTALVEITQP